MTRYDVETGTRSGQGSGGSLRPSTTAVIVIDMINHQLTPDRCFLAAMREAGTDLTYIVGRTTDMVIPNIQRLLDAARGSGCLVAYVRVGSATGDYHDTNTNVRPMMEAWGASDGAWACDVVSALRPQPGDLSLMKAGSSAFTAPSLHGALESASIESVVYVGVVTDGCVMLSAGAGFDLGYTGYVVSDGTATFSPETQSAAENLMRTFMAEIVTTDDLVSRLRDHEQPDRRHRPVAEPSSKAIGGAT